MFKGLWISDAHYSGQPPLMRKDGYGDQILDKMRFALETAQQQDRVVFFGGDLFHRKSDVSIREINKMIDLLKEFDPMRMILGNHDIQGHNPDIETRAVGVLVKAGVVKLIHDNAEVTFDGVTVTGKNYHAHYEESEPWCREVHDSDSYHIHMLHALVTDTSLPFECVGVQEVAENMTADLIINGHYHKYWEDKEIGFYNIGSLARIAMDKNSMNKTPIALLVDVENGKAKISKLEIPFEDEVWVSDIKRDTLNSDEVEEFAKSIEDMDINSDEDLLKEILKDEDDGVEELVYKYLGE